MPFSIALPFYEFQEHFYGGYFVKDFYAEFEKFAYGKPRLIDIEYKYGGYADGKTIIHWRCRDETDWRTTKYGGSTDFATWWCALTDDYEDESCDNCGERDCDCDGTDSSEGDTEARKPSGPVTHTCCLCGGDAGMYGNNPDPLADGKTHKCCDECNFKRVIPARIANYRAYGK